MKSVVLGTAGHIDHGKTSLVKALTGIDTDRLLEEKRRGISIELGFARMEIGDVRFGIVDVPGHERFIKNMLAGAGGIDMVLLVVAADEGVMPQTREHLDIIDFLEVERGVVALTKSDLVDEEAIEIARLDAEEAIASTTINGAPIIPVSSTTGAGLDELKRALVAAAATIHARPESGAFRLPIDRVFVMEGFGTVVTGTCFSGSVGIGDRLDILPSGKQVRVRRIQVHGHDAERAFAGQRTALALHGVSKDEVQRGEHVVSPESLTKSWMVDVRLRVSPRWVRPIRHRERVRFHLASSEDLARIALLEGEKIEPGKSALAQIRLETPVVPAVGDRFVVRSYSPMHTMAGGTVIDPHPKKHGRQRTDEIEALRSREEGGHMALFLETVGDAGLKGVKTQDLVEATSLTREEVEQAVAAEMEIGSIRRSENGRIFSADVWGIARRTILEQGRRFQERHPMRWGMTREEFRTALGKEASSPVVGELLEELAKDGEIELRGDKVRIGGGEIAFEGKAATERERIDAAFRTAGCAPPDVKEVVAAGRDRALATEIVSALLDQEVLIKINPDILLHREAWAALLAALRKIAARDKTISVQAIREELGISRKYSVPILEYLDARKVTRREGDVRVLLET